MTAHDYDDYVREDLARIEARAMTLYALDGNSIPWPVAFEYVREKFLERAASELWDESALRFDPSAPYYESESTQ